MTDTPTNPHTTRLKAVTDQLDNLAQQLDQIIRVMPTGFPAAGYRDADGYDAEWPAHYGHDAEPEFWRSSLIMVRSSMDSTAQAARRAIQAADAAHTPEAVQASSVHQEMLRHELGYDDEKTGPTPDVPTWADSETSS